MDEVPFRDVVHHAAGLRRARAQDVEVARQRDRSDGSGRDTTAPTRSACSILRQMRLESQEIRYHESRCEEARNFNNKIWNATRYMLALPEGLPAALTLPPEAALTLADRWILTRLHDTIVADGRAASSGYDFGNAAETIWRFVWYEFCDWYVEATKAPRRIARRAPRCCRSCGTTRCGCCIRSRRSSPKRSGWRSPHDGKTIVTATWPDPLEVPVDRDAAPPSTSLRGTVERLRNHARGDRPAPARARWCCDVPANVSATSCRHLLALLATAAIGAQRAGAARRRSRRRSPPCSARAPRGVLEERYRKECAAAALGGRARRDEAGATRPSSPRRRPTWLRRSARNSKATGPSSQRAEAGAARTKGDQHDRRRIAASSRAATRSSASSRGSRTRFVEPDDAQQRARPTRRAPRRRSARAQRLAAEIERISGHAPRRSAFSTSISIATTASPTNCRNRRFPSTSPAARS